MEPLKVLVFDDLGGDRDGRHREQHDDGERFPRQKGEEAGVVAAEVGHTRCFDDVVKIDGGILLERSVFEDNQVGKQTDETRYGSGLVSRHKRGEQEAESKENGATTDPKHCKFERLRNRGIGMMGPNSKGRHEERRAEG